MAIFDRFRSSTPAEKSALDINSPRLLELIRGGTTHSNVVSAESAMRLATVYSCVKVLSETISTLSCHLYKKDGDALTIQDLPLAALLRDSPNSFQTAAEFWQQQVVNLCLRGNSYNYVTRTSSGRIVEVLPLPVDAVTVQVTPQNNVVYTVTLGDGKGFRASVKDVLHFKGMTLDGVTGISPIAYNGALLGHAIQSRDHANSVYENGATPRGVLQTEGTLSDAAFENLRDSWNSTHGGTSGANRVAILEAGLEFKPVSMSPADVQLLESRKMSRSEVAGIFRVPPHMLADLDKATYSNIGHQSLDFYKSAIHPWLRAFEQRLNFTLIDTASQRFKFDVTELLRGDITAEVAAYKALLEIGVMSPNEVRGKLGMNPREGGDDFVSQSNNLTFGDQQPAPAETPPAVAAVPEAPPEPTQ